VRLTSTTNGENACSGVRPAEAVRLRRDSPDSDRCRAIIDVDRYLYLAEQGFRVEYQGELQ
jgi:hypothetical protein